MLSLMSSEQSISRTKPTVAKQEVAKPLPVLEILQDAPSSQTLWDLASSSEQKDQYKPKTGDEAAEDIEKYTQEKLGTKSLPELIAEQRLMEKYRSELEALLKASSVPLLYNELPVRFASRDGELTLLLTTVASDNVYNTLRLETKERAAKEIQDTVLPELKQFRIVRSPAIKNFGVIVVYGTRDFSDSDSSPRPETVALIASAANCQKLEEAEITEEDFVASSDIYIVGQTLAVRKVKLSLDNN